MIFVVININIYYIIIYPNGELQYQFFFFHVTDKSDYGSVVLNVMLIYYLIYDNIIVSDYTSNTNQVVMIPQSMNQGMSQWISKSMNSSINQSINLSIAWSIDLSFTHWFLIYWLIHLFIDSVFSLLFAFDDMYDDLFLSHLPFYQYLPCKTYRSHGNMSVPIPSSKLDCMLLIRRDYKTTNPF